MTKDFVGAILIAFISSGLWPVIVPRIMERKHERRLKEVEQREHDRDEWMRESEQAYKRVSRECKSCHDQLETMRRELGVVKDALLNRIEALDEILPYITNLPDDKVRELRSANRAHRQAVFRGRP